LNLRGTFVESGSNDISEITLYGMTQETYESMTGVRGSFKRCMEGIQLLIDRKVPLKLKTCVTTLNQHELQDMKEYAQGLGVEFRFDPVINPRVDGSKSPCELRISPQQVVDFDLEDQRRVKAWNEFLESVRRERPDSLFTCGGGLCSFQVDPYGELQLCTIFRRPSFGLRQAAFKEGWDSLFPAFHAQKLDRESKCWRCGLSSVCDQCPGWGHLEEDDPELRATTRRFWVSVVLGLPVLLLAMLPMCKTRRSLMRCHNLIGGAPGGNAGRPPGRERAFSCGLASTGGLSY